jgi:hypothetical protein
MPLCLSSERGLGLQPIAPLPMRNPLMIGKTSNVVCRDGAIRLATRTGTGWMSTWPAAVQVTVAGKRRTVSGFVTKGSFEAKGLNAALIPFTRHKPRLAAAALRLIKATAYGRGAPGYIWDCPADHSAALAGGCRHYYGTGQWPEGGCAARAVLKRLPAELLPRLAAYFDRLGRFQSTPPPPPPA